MSNTSLQAKTSPRVSVVIPCRNEREHIASCLRDILAQEPVPGGIEVLVAEGGSNDGTREEIVSVMMEDNRVRFVDNPGRIASTGLNAAIKEARGAIIVRMDAHTQYAPDYIRTCVEVLEQTGADNVGGPARTRARSYLGKAIAAAYHSSLTVGGARFHNPEFEGYVDTVTYGCWRRGAFERFGHFDEELVRNQDDEFNLRIVRQGGKIYQSPKIRSWYSPRRSLGALFRQYAQYGYWKVRVIQKHHLPASWRHLVPGAFLLALALLGALALFSKAALWSWLAVLAAYSLFSLAASVDSASQSGWRFFPVLPAVVGCYHFGYGYGFLRGFLDFVLRNRGRSASFTTLTRK